MGVKEIQVTYRADDTNSPVPSADHRSQKLIPATEVPPGVISTLHLPLLQHRRLSLYQPTNETDVPKIQLPSFVALPLLFNLLVCC